MANQQSKLEFELFDSQIERTQNKVNLIRLYQFDDILVRLRLSSDAYQFQSYAIAEIWTARWTEIWTILPGCMQTKEGLCYHKSDQPPDPDWFRADVLKLLMMAEKVIRVSRLA